MPRRRWQAVTLSATMTLAGRGEAVQFPGALDRDSFDTLIEAWPVPTPHPGQVIGGDNLGVPQSARAASD